MKAEFYRRLFEAVSFSETLFQTIVSRMFPKHFRSILPLMYCMTPVCPMAIALIKHNLKSPHGNYGEIGKIRNMRKCLHYLLNAYSTYLNIVLRSIANENVTLTEYQRFQCQES
jgi:hypothetical protein